MARRLATIRALNWWVARARDSRELRANFCVLQTADPKTGEYKLRIDEATPADGAAYRVLFATDRGDVFSGAVANVRPKRVVPTTRPAVFTTPLTDVTIPEGETLTLKCQCDGDPAPAVVWRRNGEELRADDRITIRLALDGTATLRIRDARKSDAGEFSVTAKNEAGESSSSCRATVLSADELPSAPKFVIPLAATQTALGATATFNVKVRGVPMPSVTFKLDGRPLDVDGARVRVEELGDGAHRLTIADVREADFGELVATASNESGSDECRATFSPSSDREKQRDSGGYAPRFNVALWDRRVPEQRYANAKRCNLSKVLILSCPRYSNVSVSFALSTA